MKLADTLKLAAEQYAEGNGLFVVSVDISKDNDVEVVIDADDRDVTLDDCVGMTGYIQERVSRDEEDYSLTIGSAGLTSPFKVFRQWKKAVGTEIQLTRKSGERVNASLLSADEEGVEISFQRKAEGKGAKAKETVTEHLLYSDIKTAKPIIKF
ncbi:MAG: ribosome assembly cofactor RimP [Bacteroidales bacterium]|nr:ribosome assembly cofactor RimP [Bacteroidales bacterium]